MEVIFSISVVAILNLNKSTMNCLCVEKQTRGEYFCEN